MPTNFPSWGHGREGLESHFREKLQIPYFWSRVRSLVQGAAAALFKVRIAEWHATKRRFGESAAVRDSPPFLKPTKFSAST